MVKRIVQVMVGGVAASAALLAASRPAEAIPSFAAQTGLPCAACHIGFPQLTPFGRLFKMKAYVLGNQDFPDAKNFSAMVEGGYTHLNNKVAGGLSPDYPSNNAWSIQQTSLFYGGVLDKQLGLGAFVQGTFDGISHQFTWDNTDIRLARGLNLFGMPVVYGVTFNNNPTMTDLWNTLPAWGYPFISDSLGMGPTASLQINNLAQTVAGFGGYSAINITPEDMLYGEVDLYKSLPDHTAFALGAGPSNGIAGVTPYWRVAYQHSMGENSIEVGASGLTDHPYPSGLKHGPTDNLTDVGLDLQFQHIEANQSFSVQASWFHEYQHWGASYRQGDTANLNDALNVEAITASYLWRQMFGITESFNSITGSGDTGLYNTSSSNANGKPNTDSFTTELDYYPFNRGGPKFFPWANAKFFAEYTTYTQFNGLAHNYDGNGRNAGDNNVFFTGIWFVF